MIDAARADGVAIRGGGRGRRAVGLVVEAAGVVIAGYYDDEPQGQGSGSTGAGHDAVVLADVRPGATILGDPARAIPTRVVTLDTRTDRM